MQTYTKFDIPEYIFQSVKALAVVADELTGFI